MGEKNSQKEFDQLLGDSAILIVLNKLDRA